MQEGGAGLHYQFVNMTFWDRIAGIYDLAERTNRRAVQGMISQTAQRVPRGGTFLECAAGTGEISLAVSGKAKRILCTDQSLQMLERAKKKAKKRKIKPIEFAQRDLLNLPEADGVFDVVCAANVLHLLEEPEAAIEEMERVTKPGGLLIFPTFLTEEAGIFMRFCVTVYRLLGFRQKKEYSKESYQALFKGRQMEFKVIPGKMPVGLAIIQKPISGKRSGTPFREKGGSGEV